MAFADVAGQDAAVAELRELKDFLADRDRFVAIGAQVPEGVLPPSPSGPPSPPYVGPALNTDPVVEVVDHVVPAVVVLAVSLAALAAGARARGTAMFAAGLVVALAGFWMVATHVPLLAQASRQEVPWGAALWHPVPGVAVVALGAVWALRWSAEPAPE